MVDYAPTLRWDTALRVARASGGSLPEISRRDLEQLVADLRVKGRIAGEIAANFAGVDGVGASEIRVVDWAGWTRAARRMADGAFETLGLPSRPDGVLTSARGVLNGVLAGLAMGRVAPLLLGQYDAFTGDNALYLIAPTILQHERTRGFNPGDFRLWVALHEQAHAVQFHRAPWLREYLSERIRGIVSRETKAAGERAAMAEIRTAMTFLEGHADHVSDVAARAKIKSVRELRKAFIRPERTGLLGRLSATFDKASQYRDGLAFCQEIALKKGSDALLMALESPESLPTAKEIANPRDWLARVHG